MQKDWTRLNRKFFNRFLLIFLVFSFAFSSPAISEAANPMVRLETTMGDITLELYPDLADAFFGTDISSATHVRYTSDKNVIAFQVDASADNMMLDGLGSLPLP